LWEYYLCGYTLMLSHYQLLRLRIRWLKKELS